MKVKEIMIQKVIKIKKGMTLKETASILCRNKISGAPVIDENDKLIGIISEKDLFKVLYPSYREFFTHPEAWTDPEKIEERVKDVSTMKVEKLMTQGVTTVSPETPVVQIGAIMLAEGIHRVPVIDQGKIVGIVDREDIFHRILKKELGI
jgi:CBS domain-containing protein